MKTTQADIKIKRTATISAVNREERTVEVCFASEAPIWDGSRYIITLLDCEHCDMSILNAGAPVFMEHSQWDHIGAVVPDSVRVDSDRKARAKLRISRNREEIFKDIEDGILNQVSVAGGVWDLARVDANGNADTYQAGYFVPDEISFVKRAADQSARVGRSANPQTNESMTDNTQPTPPVPTPAENHTAADDVEKLQRSYTQLAESAGLKNPGKLVMRAIAQNKSEREFAGMIADEIERSYGEPVANKDSVEQIQRAADAKFKDFSISRLLRSIASGAHCKEMELVSAKSGRYSIPASVIARAVTTTNVSGAIATHTGSIAARLRTKSGLLDKMTVIPNLPAGDYVLPVVTAGTTAQGVGEGTGASASTMTIAPVRAQPRTASCYIEITRKTLAKSDAELEQIIMEDAFAGLAECIEQAAIYGTGESDKEAQGLANISNVKKITRTAATPTRADILALLKSPKSKRLTSPATLASSTNTALDMMSVKETENKFLYDNGVVCGRELTETNLIKDGDIICGPFAELFLFLWGANSGGIEVVREQSAKTGDVSLGFYLDYDIATRYPEAFAISSAPASND